MKIYSYLKYSILLVPIIFFLVGSYIEQPKFGNDPNYVYLMNAVGLCAGNGVGYIDHPGTTVIQISAFTIAIKHALYNPESDTLLQHVFKDPHTFILAIRNVFLLLNSLILLLLGWVAVKKTKSIWIALFLQATVFITTNLLDHIWAKISPAPILFLITNILVIITLFFYADYNRNRWKYVISYSLVIGAGIVTKATFVPLAALPFIIIPTIKKKLFYALGIIPSFVLFSIPIIPEYESMYYWFKDLGSHSGIYGSGNKGFIDWQIFFPNIVKILINNPVFAIAFIIGSIILLIKLINHIRIKTKLNDEIKILAGLIVSIGAGVLLVAKHYHSNHYLIPELLLTGITIFFILKVLLSEYSREKANQYLWPTVVIFLFVFLIIKQPSRISYINNGYKLTNVETDSTFNIVEKDFADYTKIYYYPVSLNKFSALNFGNVYSKQIMLPNLKELYGDVYFLNTVTETFQNWTTDINIEEIIEKNGKKVILVSGPRDEKEAKNLDEKGFPVQTFYKGRIQSIYKLDTLNYNYLNSSEEQIISFVNCNMDALNYNNSKFLASNNIEYGNAIHQSNEISRSGNYSIKMTPDIKYAGEYVLKNLKIDDNYEIEVWRKSKTKSGMLVVSSYDAKLFFKTQQNTIESYPDGWDLIRIKFTVTPEISNEILKVYLLNKDKELIYFDDLSIKRYSSNNSN